jgi:hypothetical protein
MPLMLMALTMSLVATERQGAEKCAGRAVC